MPTIKDIAKLANVSTATVSRALNGKLDVSEATRKRIFDLVEEFDYTPNSIARGLITKKINIIGVVVPDIVNPFYPEVFRGIEDEARGKGYSVIYLNTDYELGKEREALVMLKQKSVAGLLWASSTTIFEGECKKDPKNMPIILMDNYHDKLKIPAVTIDNVASAFTAVKYLLSLGHKSIAHIAGNIKNQTARDRMVGYKMALENNGIEFNSDLILYTDYTQKTAKEKSKQFFGKYKPTAIFVANDIMAVGCYEAIFELGMSIPEDISVMGHDDIYISSIIKPKLTTMRQDKRELGKLAARKLIAKLDDGDSDPNTQTSLFLPTKLIQRESTRIID